MRSFYVDDCLKSVSSVQEAISLSSELRDLAQKGGFRLTQWVSNDLDVLCSIHESERAKNVKTADLTHDEFPSEKSLGVCGMWRVIPLGFTSVFQTSLWLDEVSFLSFRLCMILSVWWLCLCWWERWSFRSYVGWSWDGMNVSQMTLVSDGSSGWIACGVSISFLFPNVFSLKVLDALLLWYFADASDRGYGCVSYMRFLDDVVRVHCSLVMGRSRVAPLKQMTIPRMDLTAAALAVPIDAQLRKELSMSFGEGSF